MNFAGNGRKILVLEDEPAVQTLINKQLTSQGFVVTVASDGRHVGAAVFRARTFGSRDNAGQPVARAPGCHAQRGDLVSSNIPSPGRRVRAKQLWRPDGEQAELLLAHAPVALSAFLPFGKEG